MSENPRDTQFAGFASLLLGEMLQASKTYSGLIDSESGAWQEAMQQIIARRAYDLMKEACWTIESEENDGRLTDKAMLDRVPDLTEWPDEDKKGL